MTNASPTAPVGWIRRPVWDVAVLAWGFVPFYAWIALGPLGGNVVDDAWKSAFAQALGVTLALNFLHRHYVFLMVYGDRRALSERRRAYLILPPIMLGIVAAGFLLGGGKASAVVLGVLGVWNVWHVVQQRYGILRIYAGRAGGGLETREHARRDMALLWSTVLLTACVLVQLRQSTFVGHREARKAVELLAPLTQGIAGWLLLATGASLFAFAAQRWIRAEIAASPKTSRLPRLMFLTSTFALLAIFLVHGPVIGYLCFGVAHSIEYVGFVHHFGEKKYTPESDRPGAARFFLGSIARSPLVIAPLLLAFWLVRDHRFATAYVVYYSTTAGLHFLFDGWIWKVRKAEVAKPLGIG